MRIIRKFWTEKRSFYQKLLDERRENLRKLGKADDTQDARNSDFLR